MTLPKCYRCGKQSCECKDKVRHVASLSGGKDSTAMVLRLIEEGRPLDEIVFFDTGWEFPQMYDHIAKVEAFTGRTVTRLQPRRSFLHWMLRQQVIARKGPKKGMVHHVGYGWPSPTRRWCTREKAIAIERHLKMAVRYIGFAADESHRMSSVSLMSKPYVRKYPLVEWNMNEAACLAYCRDRGFDWGGLYDIFPRVSCFCCPLKQIGELRSLRWYFPDLWAKMLAWDAEMWDAEIGPCYCGFRGYKTVADLEKRFAGEDARRFWLMKQVLQQENRKVPANSEPGEVNDERQEAIRF